MASVSRTRSVEPLFAQNARLWLRIWGATQAAAVLVAASAEYGRNGPGAGLVSIVLGLALYHVAGNLAYGWILQRTWAVLLYVPVGWVLVLAALRVNASFALLVLGAIVEGFIFLPFAWAAVTLGLVMTALAVGVGVGEHGQTLSVLLTRVGIVVATGVMVFTVLLYIHRANREAALRAALLEELATTQRDLADRAREAGVLSERQRLSRDIHDTLAQAFTSILKHLEAVELALGEQEHARVMPHLRHAQQASRTSLTEIRQVLHALRPAMLTEAPLVSALERVVQQWSAANGVEATFTAEPLPVLQPDADVILLRATQEALGNVARHAGATQVVVTIGVVEELVLLTVEDDGRGLPEETPSSTEKLGLTGMRERARSVGGHVLIETTAGAGTSLTIALPLSAIAQAQEHA